MNFYIVDDIDQGTQKWHQWRRKVIGASEANVIMGENRWKGRQQLIDEKLGLAQSFSGNEITREGNSLEPVAREALAAKFNMQLKPIIVQDAHEPFLAASLDAINSEKDRIFEIKCGTKTYEAVSATSRIPRHYFAQVQHMLMVTGMDSLIFSAYRPQKRLLTLEVFRDDKYIRELRKKEKDFVREVERLGHKFQYEFRGYQIGTKNHYSPSNHKELTKKTLRYEWRLEQGLLAFWDGSKYLIGEDPGLYELIDQIHYWDGEEWFLPSEVGVYDLNGIEMFWNGEIWE